MHTRWEIKWEKHTLISINISTIQIIYILVIKKLVECISFSHENVCCLDTLKYKCGVSETEIKKLELTRNEKIYSSYKKKGQENKVHNTEKQNAAHTEDLESESSNWSCLKEKGANEDQWLEDAERAACCEDK